MHQIGSGAIGARRGKESLLMRVIKVVFEMERKKIWALLSMELYIFYLGADSR